MRKRWEMFERKDLVVYGATGVCEVVDIGTPQIEGIDKERIYYTLHPVYSNEESYIHRLTTQGWR
jgi:CarD family transcriptional regulator